MTKHHIGEQLAHSLPLSTIGEPFTIDEIDKHPDAQRMWRTIQEVAFYLTLDVNSDLIYTQEEMDDAKSKAYDRGYIAGKDEADKDYDSGWDAGFECGHDTGYDKGYKEGLEDGRKS